MAKSRQQMEEDAVRRTNLVDLPDEAKEILRNASEGNRRRLAAQEMLAEILEGAGEMPKDREAVKQRMERRKKMRQASPPRKPE